MTQPSKYIQIEISCRCGAELVFHCQARIGNLAGPHFCGVCPDCGARHDMPDNVLRVMRKNGGEQGRPSTE